VGARKEKYIFSLSPINSRKEGRKKGELFLSSPIYCSKWGATSKKPAGVIGVDFFRIIKMRMIFKFRKMKKSFVIAKRYSQVIRSKSSNIRLRNPKKWVQ